MVKNDSEIQQIVDGVLLYLKKEKKEGALPLVIAKLQEYSSGQKWYGEIVSTIALTDGQTEKIKSLLEKKFKRDIELTNLVDESIIGGLVIKLGDIVIDESLRSQLIQLKNEVYGS